MEQQTGIIFANSPTQKVQGQILESLTKGDPFQTNVIFQKNKINRRTV
ncbi:MAG: hypothetical protein ACLRX7_08880 [Acutalibacteraceae bacterium]